MMNGRERALHSSFRIQHSSLILSILSILVNISLENNARRELEGARAAGAEDAARGRYRPPETRRAQEAGTRGVVTVAHEHVREAGVVDVRDAEHVRHVEEVEGF